MSSRKGNLILTENQWNGMLKWIPNTEKESQEEEILKYLREASAEMKEKWPENNKRMHEIKQESNKNEKMSLNPDMQRYEEIHNATPDERRKMIEEAERFVSVRKIKECPIELRSAAILSENLHANKLQLAFQAQQKKEDKLKTKIRNKMDIAQSVSWLNDGWEHRTKAHLIAKQHKKELKEQIEEKKASDAAHKQAQIDFELKMIGTQDEEMQELKLAERHKKEGMHVYMRQHEKQSNLMAQQKRDRVKRENEVIDILVKVHNEGKNKIKEMIKEQETHSKIDRIKDGLKLQKMAYERHIEEAKRRQFEQQLIEKARMEQEKVLDEREVKEKERKLKLKSERLIDYSQSLKATEVRKALKKEEDKEYFQTRVINDVISHQYSKMRKEANAKKTREILDNLKKEAMELREQQAIEKEESQKAFNKVYNDDTSDEKFFEYAMDLKQEAERKNRPIKPIMEAIKAYKTRQCIGIKQKTRPHEISNVPIDMVSFKSGCDKGKSKRRLKYEEDERKMANVYRGTKFYYS